MGKRLSDPKICGKFDNLVIEAYTLSYKIRLISFTIKYS